MGRPATVSPERILAAAAAEFAARGYGGGRVDRIARRARVNKAMIYYHFGSKQALYRELLRATFSQVAGRLREVAASGAPAAAMLDRAIETIAELAREKSFFPAIMLREVAEGGAHLDRATLAELSGVPAAFTAMISQGVKSGAFRAVDPIAAYFTMIAPIIFYLASAPIRRELAAARLLDRGSPPADQFIKHVQDTMRRALVVEAPPAARSTS
jgi:TetR/AcrR family transcriptional regulator